ncbi:hypothetical protein JXA56_05400 [Candidatus Micrarchaeota archaeon]|nr:hypothetical protein [Candidatus Micrarchaeota archaeon]
MVWVRQTASKSFFICSECSLGYDDPRTAFQCEEYCRLYKCSSKKIAEKSVYRA